MKNRKSTMRGRLPGKISREDTKIIEYIFRISMSHEIDPKILFEKILSAWRYQESTYKDLKIECRTRNNAHTFLFSNSQGVIAQFPIPERILLKTNPLKELVNEKSLTNRYAKKNNKLNKREIENLKVGMKRVKVKARVLEIPEPKLVFTKYGSSEIVTNILIGDETGTIMLSLWNEQINQVSLDDVIKIENAKVARYRGKLQLRLGRNGTLSIIEGDGFPTTEKIEKNFSTPMQI